MNFERVISYCYGAHTSHEFQTFFTRHALKDVNSFSLILMGSDSAK